MANGQRSQEEKIMDRIQALINQANDDSVTEGHRDTLLLKADQLMTAYRIDEANLNSRKPRDSREKPIVLSMPFPGYSDKWFEEYRSLLYHVAATAKVRVHFTRRLSKVTATAVGFQDDIDYMQMLWLSIHLTFSSKLNPSWNSTLNEDENVKILKEAGWKWEDIAKAGGFDWPDGGKLKRAYRRQCNKEGVEPTPHTQRHEAYRQSFANAFSSVVASRLLKMQDQRDATEKTSGAELVLRDRTTEVDKELYRLFPHLRPPTNEDLARAKAAHAKLEKERREAWEALSPEEQAKRAAEQEREYRRWEREQAAQKAKRYDDRGASAGRHAGQSVDLSAGRNAVSQTSRKELS